MHLVLHCTNYPTKTKDYVENYFVKAGIVGTHRSQDPHSKGQRNGEKAKKISIAVFMNFKEEVHIMCCRPFQRKARVKACVGKVPPEPRLKSLKEKGLPISG